jgi:hypothetical protein
VNVTEKLDQIATRDNLHHNSPITLGQLREALTVVAVDPDAAAAQEKAAEDARAALVAAEVAQLEERVAKLKAGTATPDAATVGRLVG